MAMKNCKECGKPVSSKAKLCPHCGTRTKNAGILSWIVAILLGLFIFGFVKSCNETSERVASGQAPSTPSTQSRPAAIAPPSWQYSNDVDQMTSKITSVASIESIDQIDLKFPYSGRQHLSIALRKHPRYGTDVLLSIPRGQFKCSVVDGCTILARFDDDKAIQFHANEPDDGSSNVLFIRDHARFIARLKTADKTIIQATFFNNGTHTVSFSTKGLTWPPGKHDAIRHQTESER